MVLYTEILLVKMGRKLLSFPTIKWPAYQGIRDGNLAISECTHYLKFSRARYISVYSWMSNIQAVLMFSHAKHISVDSFADEWTLKCHRSAASPVFPAWSSERIQELRRLLTDLTYLVYFVRALQRFSKK